MLPKLRPVARGLCKLRNASGRTFSSKKSIVDGGVSQEKRILYVSASPTPTSLVTSAADEIIGGLEFPHRVIGPRNLWSDQGGHLPNYLELQ
jgi:hypothetical protein